jgi:hypothetical protein
MTRARHSYKTTTRYDRPGAPARAQRNANLPFSLEKVAELDDSATRDAIPIYRIAYGAIHVTFRAGANPTGMRATSFKALMSTTETLLVCSLAT